RQDMRMLQVGGCLDLLEEAAGTEQHREVGMHDLDRDLAVVPRVVRQEHGGHAARAELALQQVAVGEGRLQRLEGLVHLDEDTVKWSGGQVTSPALPCRPRSSNRRPAASSTP